MLLMGFILGVKHAMEADHVAAVATLAAQQTTVKRAVRQGVAWGIGHASVLFVFGGLVLLLGAALPEKVAHSLEFAVGVMLIILGIDVIRRLRQERLHFHAHRHEGGVMHLHMHSHAGQPNHDHHGHDHPQRMPFPRRALFVGMVHGMAGSAALILLSLATAPSVAAGLLYMAVFGVGSILGMAVMSVVIAVPLRAAATLRGSVRNWLTVGVGVSTCVLGALIVYQIGYVDGLFM